MALAFATASGTDWASPTYLPTGDFLIVDPIEEGEKVKAEIAFVLCKDHVHALQRDGLW